MCGRSSLTKTEKEIEDRFGSTFYSDELERYNPLPNYNVAPSHMHPVITNQDNEKIHLYRWGLIPSWAKDIKIGYRMINARAETLLEKKAFKKPLQTKRCLVIMDGFYEWKKDGKQKQPYRIVTTDQDIFTVAGLWETWHDKTENHLIHSFTVITREPNELMKNIHDRMPAILTPENERLWLSDGIPVNDLLELLIPYPSEHMHAYKVGKEIGNVRNNHSGLIALYEEGQQGDLFDSSMN